MVYKVLYKCIEYYGKAIPNELYYIIHFNSPRKYLEIVTIDVSGPLTTSNIIANGYYMGDIYYDEISKYFVDVQKERNNKIDKILCQQNTSI